MSRLVLAALALLTATACSKCGEAPKPVTSNVVVSPPDAGPHLAEVGDLRTGLITTVPEFRGVSNLVTIGVLERKLSADPADGGSLVEALEPYFKDKRWTRGEADAGPMIAHNKPYFLEAERLGADTFVRVGLVIPGEDVVKLIQTPAPLTTQQLGTLMPLPPGITSKQDTFFFESHYAASDEMSTKLLKQLIAGHVQNGWQIEQAPPELLSPDSGLIPDGFKAVLRDPNTRGTLTIGRTGTHNAITWEQVLAR